MLRHHRTDFPEDPATVLAKEEFEGITFAVLAVVQIAGVVSDVVRILRSEASPDHFPGLPMPRTFLRL
jgi:hypothetical protein